jgi:hypothetical protein
VAAPPPAGMPAGHPATAGGRAQADGELVRGGNIEV